MSSISGRDGLLSDGGALAAGANLDVTTSRVPALILGAALACIAALVFATLPLAGAPSTHSLALRDGLQSPSATAVPISLAPAASASIGASDRSFWPVRRGPSLLTEGGGIHATFSASSAALRAPDGTLDLSLAAVGRGQRLDSVAAVAPMRVADQVVYRHGWISEVYRNGPYGLEQGFTLLKRPRAGSGSLTLALGISGSLAPGQVGSQIVFRTKAGVAALRYGQLSAVDAAGRRLPAQMQIRNGTLELLIDDSNARYPLRIDPFIQQKLTGRGEVSNGFFGYSVALSGDGATALIGAPFNAGSAWVFTRSGEEWTQQGEKLTDGVGGPSGFGDAVSLSDNGDTALICACAFPGGKSSAAYVFTRSGSTWSGERLPTGTTFAVGGVTGGSLALSGDGNTAILGDDVAPGGDVGVFVRSGSTWGEQGAPFRPTKDEVGGFGESVALSKDGNTALTYQYNDHHAFVFTRSGEKWTQQGKALAGSGTGKGFSAGSVALSGDGQTALIGATENGHAGGAWVFIQSGEEWVQQGEKLTSSGNAPGYFGSSVALSEDGNTALIGEAQKERAWLYTRSGETWTQQGGPLTGAEKGHDEGFFGWSVSLSRDASTALVGGWDATGAAWVYANGTPRPPSVVTGAASSVTSNSSTLNATVNPNGTEVSDCHFEYGTTTLYGSSTTCTTLPGSGNSAVAVAAPVGSLASNTTYHFRIVATNLGGTSYGLDATVPTPPSAQEEAAITKKHEEEAAARKKAEEEAAARKKKEQEKTGVLGEKEEMKAPATGSISLDGSTITVQRNHEALIKLTCTGTATCSGKLTLTVKRTTGKGKNKHIKTHPIGTATFSIPAGKSETVKLTLNGIGRALLGVSHGHLNATLTILKASPSPSKTQNQGVHLVKVKSKK